MGVVDKGVVMTELNGYLASSDVSFYVAFAGLTKILFSSRTRPGSLLLANARHTRYPQHQEHRIAICRK
jgi:hypothetical protein